MRVKIDLNSKPAKPMLPQLCGRRWLMNAGKSIFSQLMDFLPSADFANASNATRRLQTQEFFVLGPVSLHGLCATNVSRKSARHRSLSSRQQTKLYHMGIRGRVSRNTFANANSVRDWRIYADFAHLLITTPENYIATTTSAWLCRKRFTHSMPRPSTCVFRCFPGPNFASAKAQ